MLLVDIVVRVQQKHVCPCSTLWRAMAPKDPSETPAGGKQFTLRGPSQAVRTTYCPLSPSWGRELRADHFHPACTQQRTETGIRSMPGGAALEEMGGHMFQPRHCLPAGANSTFRSQLLGARAISPILYQGELPSFLEQNSCATPLRCPARLDHVLKYPQV